MLSPSSMVLINRCDIYPAVTGRDVDGGTTYTYPTRTGASVPCSIQAQGVLEIIDDQQRITQLGEYKIMFANQQAVKPRDKIVYVDPLGVMRELFVEAQRDEAGRGAAFTVRATERI